MEIQPLGCCFDGCVLRLRLLVAYVPGSPASGRYGAFLTLDLVVRCSSTSGAEVELWRPGTLCWSPVRSTLRQLANLSVFLGFSRLWIRFSSSHCWSLLHWRHLSVVWLASAVRSLLHWRHLSVVRLASAVRSLLHWRHLSVVRLASAGDRYLSGLWTMDCGLPLRRRIRARVWFVACLPLLWEWRSATSQYPRCFVHRPEFISGQSWLLLDFYAVCFLWGCAGLVLPRPLGACRSTLRLFTGWFLLSVVVSSKNLAWLFS